jgi:hypothetical protein
MESNDEFSNQHNRFSSAENEEDDNGDKLNLNKKNTKIQESARDDLIKEDNISSKEDNTDQTKQQKEGTEEEEPKRVKTKKKSTKKSKKNEIHPNEEQNIIVESEEKDKNEGENKENNEKGEKKEGEELPKEGEDEKKVGEEPKKEGEEGGKKDEQTPKESIATKIKFPITPYKVSESYQKELLNVLKKQNKVRPSALLEPERDDITRNIKDLDDEEENQKQLEKKEDENAEDKEREDKIFLNKYKESTLLGNTMLEDPMALFHGAEKVYIDQFYKLSDLFVMCPLYFNYRISLEYKTSDTEYTAYHLFNTKEISPPCSHDCCANQAREIDINIFNLIVEPKERKIQKFIKLRKNCRCAVSCLCACCSRPTFLVETPIEMLGKITEIRTVCDPILHITDINNDVIYVVKTKCSDCAYCCRDQCCDNRKCASCYFEIYDGKDDTLQNKIGYIRKDHRSGKKIKPDYDQLVVVFPPDCICQNKILIMCSALAIEYLYFQNLSNTKRCSGKPRFLNSYSD